jgi:hypothetical protein
LKPFTRLCEGRAINLYNIDRCRGVPNVSVRDQCSGNYFYGDDLHLEKLLQKSEDWFAQTLKEIFRPKHRLVEAHEKALRHFCYLQYIRTDAAFRRAALMMTEVWNITSKGESPPDWRGNMREAVQIGMATFAETMHVVEDLKVCLVRNETHCPFITSDDPAVLANRWYLQNPRARGLSGGVGSAGALFMLPLAPHVLCLIYDGDVYSIPNALGWTVVNKVADINAFNQHQFLGCLANVYFSDWTMLADIEAAYNVARLLRPAKRYEIVTAVPVGEDIGGRRFRAVARDEASEAKELLIHTRTIAPHPSRWPSIVKWRPSPKIYTNGSGVGFVRRSQVTNGEGFRRIQ